MPYFFIFPKVLPIYNFTNHEERSFLTQKTILEIYVLSTHKNEHFELLFIKIAQ